LPMTLQFIIVMIASAINDRLQRKLEYVEEERRIRLASAYAGVIHLLMTDVVMPEMHGRDLARNLLTSFPALKRLFMSGYTADVIAHQGVLDEGVHFIQKPFSKKDLAARVSEALERGSTDRG